MNDFGKRSVLVRLLRQDAERLTKMERLKIGWWPCRVREWKTVPVCYRCQGVGHRSAGCKEPAQEKRCDKCDQPGHIGRDCTEEEPTCRSCKEKGHTTYSKRCPNYRTLLQQSAGQQTQPDENGIAASNQKSNEGITAKEVEKPVGEPTLGTPSTPDNEADGGWTEFRGPKKKSPTKEQL